MELWDNWLFMALLVPTTWALSCILDICFVSNRIYRSPSDGPIIAGFFCVLPLFAIATHVISWHDLTLDIAMLAGLAGISYFLHVYFYFKALFILNDAPSAEIFNTLSVLFVPLFAFFLLDERLPSVIYLAIAIAFTGAAVLMRYSLFKAKNRIIACFLMAVIFISLSMVLQARVLQQLDYWHAVILFSAATFSTATIVAALQHKRWRHLKTICWRFSGVFIVAECLQLAAILASQRATDIGPSVSLVAIIETSLPLFIIAFSCIFIVFSRFFQLFSQETRQALALQTVSLEAKIIAFLLIGLAISLVHDFEIATAL